MSELDSRFFLIADNGDRLYPYKKKQLSTGRYGYALTRPGEQDRRGNGTYTESLEEVIRQVVNNGWSVRAKCDGIHSSRSGSIGLNKLAVHGYGLDAQFLGLIASGSAQPSIVINEK